MKELSLNVLDIAQNSVKARATLIDISIEETDDHMTIRISDNGCGMSRELLANVSDPFCTTRTTRKVGLGIPFFRLAAEQTGGSFNISSVSVSDDPENHGTVTTAVFRKKHIDFTPLGDIVSTVALLVQGSDGYDVTFSHTLSDGRKIAADTREMREVLDGVPLSSPEVINWLKDFLTEQYKNI